MRKFLIFALQTVLIVLLSVLLLLSGCDSESVVRDGISPSAEEETTQEVTAQISVSIPDVDEQVEMHTDNEPPQDNGTEKPPDENTASKQVGEILQNTAGDQPAILAHAVEEAGLSFDEFTFSQLVLVAAEGAQASIYCYDKGGDGLWVVSDDIGYINGYVGRNGVTLKKHEGDGCTPEGLYGLGYAFGYSSEPATGMKYRVVTEESYWVDDPNSKYYNQWVEGADGADWNSAAHLSEFKGSYAYVVVIEYNTAPNTVSGAGSAIFLHYGYEPTAGCVAVSGKNMLDILKWLDQDKTPNILIVGYQGDGSAG